ncbi:MAG: bacillithiol biosynthesis cysteine-adding enzyme BshC [Acidobacteriaceae bacterium]|nr:bacillithiol biosynthesis cysteine-adding enzyme BshC [Acidobacteriaceae bacterium]
MEWPCIRQTAIPGTTRLFADYLYDFNRVSAFYPSHFADPEAQIAAIRKVDYPSARRSAMVSALREQNGDSPVLARLAEPGTIAVVTGQQVGLFSGPAYTVFKALTAAKMAAHFNARGIPAVAIFWLATEDHDLAEVDHTWVFNHELSPTKISLTNAVVNGGSVGEVRIGEAPLSELREALGELPFAEDVGKRVADAYHSDATFGSAFRYFLNEVLKDLGILYLDPLTPAIRTIARPFLADTAERLPELVAALRQRDHDLVAAGYHAQVHIEDDTSLLFLISEGKRIPIRWKDGHFVARDRSYTLAELKDRADVLSPNALLRPVMQDYLLPTVSYVGGPSEIAYMAQSQVLYERLLGRMPVLFPRNTFTLLDGRAIKLLERYDLQVRDLLDPHEKVKSRIAARLVPAQIAEKFAGLKSAMSSSLGKVASELLAFDPTLEASAKKSTAKILYQVEKLSEKAARETMRRDQRAEKDAGYLMNLVYPQRHLQERFYSILPFLARHGMDLPRHLLEQTQLACPDHMVRAI